MADDDLSTPLGQSLKKKKRFELPFTAPQAIAARSLCAWRSWPAGRCLSMIRSAASRW